MKAFKVQLYWVFCYNTIGNFIIIFLNPTDNNNNNQ